MPWLEEVSKGRLWGFQAPRERRWFESTHCAKRSAPRARPRPLWSLTRKNDEKFANSHNQASETLPCRLLYRPPSPHAAVHLVPDTTCRALGRRSSGATAPVRLRCWTVGSHERIPFFRVLHIGLYQLVPWERNSCLPASQVTLTLHTTSIKEHRRQQRRVHQRTQKDSALLRAWLMTTDHVSERFAKVWQREDIGPIRAVHHRSLFTVPPLFTTTHLFSTALLSSTSSERWTTMPLTDWVHMVER